VKKDVERLERVSQWAALGDLFTAQCLPRPRAPSLLPHCSLTAHNTHPAHPASCSLLFHVSLSRLPPPRSLPPKWAPPHTHESTCVAFVALSAGGGRAVGRRSPEKLHGVVPVPGVVSGLLWRASVLLWRRAGRPGWANSGDGRLGPAAVAAVAPQHGDTAPSGTGLGLRRLRRRVVGGDVDGVLHDGKRCGSLGILWFLWSPPWG
jgi:hypothetical protein